MTDAPWKLQETIEQIKADTTWTSQVLDVTTTTYSVTDNDLIRGYNVFEVDAGGDTVITIPSSVNERKILLFKNAMVANTVTVQVGA